MAGFLLPLLLGTGGRTLATRGAAGLLGRGFLSRGLGRTLLGTSLIGAGGRLGGGLLSGAGSIAGGLLSAGGGLLSAAGSLGGGLMGMLGGGAQVSGGGGGAPVSGLGAQGFDPGTSVGMQTGNALVPSGGGGGQQMELFPGLGDDASMGGGGASIIGLLREIVANTKMTVLGIATLASGTQAAADQQATDLSLAKGDTDKKKDKTKFEVPQWMKTLGGGIGDMVKNPPNWIKLAGLGALLYWLTRNKDAFTKFLVPVLKWIKEVMLPGISAAFEYITTTDWATMKTDFNEKVLPLMTEMFTKFLTWVFTAAKEAAFAAIFGTTETKVQDQLREIKQNQAKIAELQEDGVTPEEENLIRKLQEDIAKSKASITDISEGKITWTAEMYDQNTSLEAKAGALPVFKGEVTKSADLFKSLAGIDELASPDWWKTGLFASNKRTLATTPDMVSTDAGVAEVANQLNIHADSIADDIIATDENTKAVIENTELYKMLNKIADEKAGIVPSFYRPNMRDVAGETLGTKFVQENLGDVFSMQKFLLNQRNTTDLQGSLDDINEVIAAWQAENPGKEVPQELIDLQNQQLRLLNASKLDIQNTIPTLQQQLLKEYLENQKLKTEDKKTKGNIILDKSTNPKTQILDNKILAPNLKGEDGELVGKTITESDNHPLKALKRSDMRLKEDIKLEGKSPSDINIYSFKYKGEEGRYEGVIAQEVPWASVVGDDSHLMVDYSKLDVEFKRLN